MRAWSLGRIVGEPIRDARGVALVEFALVLPVMLLLYLGGVQLQDGIACDRKVTRTARAAADLISQNTTGKMSAAEVDQSLSAASMVLLPYSAGPASIRITEIRVDALNRPTVAWSRGFQTRAYVRGSAATVPPAMLLPNTDYVLAEVAYAYTPPSSFGSIGPMTLKDTIYMLPRNTDQIDCDDCRS